MTPAGDENQIVVPEAGEGGTRRGSERRAGDRRRYNRRTSTSDAGPPYYEAFDRIATALERLEELIADALADKRLEPSSTPGERGH